MGRRLDEDPAELRHRRGKAAFDEILDREPGQRFVIEEEDRDITLGMDGVEREKRLRDRQPQKFPETRDREEKEIEQQRRQDRKSTRLKSSHYCAYRLPSSA